MPLPVLLVTDHVFPESPLPDTTLTFGLLTRTQSIAPGQQPGEVAFDAPQPVGIILIAIG